MSYQYRRGPYLKGSTKRCTLENIEPMKEILTTTKKEFLEQFPRSEERSKIIGNLQGLIDYLVKRQKREAENPELTIQEKILQRLNSIEEKLEKSNSFSSLFDDLEETSHQTNQVNIPPSSEN
uniref:Uncharacterized protein n=1 Tax=Blueberry red ringspot virus TaxID=172220 RepID=G4WV15_9VIRU|nr:hypothetical protein [Blueberry red ringspot virus]